MDITTAKASPSASTVHVDAQAVNFMNGVFGLISNYVSESESAAKPVVNLADPAEIKKCIGLDPSEPRSYDELLEACSSIMDLSVRTQHPHFHNQLFAGVHPAGMCGEFLTAAMNVSMYTFEVAPVFTVMENTVLEKMYRMVGWAKGDGDGIFCPGGSMSNTYAMNLARCRVCRMADYDVKRDGMRGAPDLVAYISDHGHYSITKAAALLGLGTANVVKVAVDHQGRMIVEDLATKLAADAAAGRTPFFIQATAGTTVLGAYDDFNAVCDVAAAYAGLWVHIDGCWGGSFLLSEEQRHVMAGSERVDSVAWNPHKMMGVPLQCAAFLTKHVGLLQEAHSANAAYLFQKDKLHATLDTGDKSVQCGRKVDVLKLWMTWASVGDEGYRKHVNKLVAVRDHLVAAVVASDNFILVAEPMCTNVCFWFIPPSARAEGGAGTAADVQKRSEEWRAQVHTAASTVKARMQTKGSCMIGFQSIALNTMAKPPNFFRMVVVDRNVAPTDMDYLLAEIETLGADC